MKVLVNKSAFGGNALGKWNKIKSTLKSTHPHLDPLICEGDEISNITREIGSKEECIVYAGGDGTFHYALNSIMDPDLDQPRFPNLKVGFIGIGSGNSFMRSSSSDSIQNIKIRTRLDTRSIDVGKVTFEDEKGNVGIRYFLANGSFGFLALANGLFNDLDFVMKILKKRNTDLASVYTFFRTLKSYKPIEIEIKIDGEMEKESVLNLQILKSNYYSGGYHFPSDNTEDSGFFDVHLTKYSSKWATLKTFVKLSLNQFERLEKHSKRQAKLVEVESSVLIPFEIDGEILFGNKFKIQCIQGVFPACS